MKRLMLAGAAVLALATAGAAQVSVGRAGTYVIRGGTIVTGTGQPIANGSVLIQDGKIAAVGANVTTPSGATEIDARGKFVYAGMIDSWTPIGLAETSQRLQTFEGLNPGRFRWQQISVWVRPEVAP